jgi:guanylate kinase
MEAPQMGKLVILSGPSGAGKSTLVRRLLCECPLPLELSVSATTRAPRRGEQDGVDYHFLSHDEFRRRREADAFLECKEVFGRGDWYGTLRQTVVMGRRAGRWVLLEIDVQGALAVLESNPDAITIFIDPGDTQELERRLRARGTDSEASIQRRLEVARQERLLASRYQHFVVNQNLDQAVKELCGVLQQHAVTGGCMSDDAWRSTEVDR